MADVQSAELIAKVRTLQVSRRRFMRGVAGAGAAAVCASQWGSAGAQSGTPTGDFDVVYSGEVFDAEGETLRVASWGGFWEETERKFLLDQLEKDFNCKVSYDSSWPWFPKFVAGGVDNPPFDVANWNLPELFKTARADEFFVPVDEVRANVPNSADLWDFAYRNGLGITYLFSQYGYAYRTDTGVPAPTQFTDFWAEHFANKRGTFITSNTLQAVFFMMASAAFGEDEKDIDAGVQAMEDAMPMKISDFTGNMQTLLERGEVEICVQHDGEPYAQMDRGIPVGWMYWTERTPILTQTKTVSMGSNDVQKRLAYAYINRACSPEFQESMAREQYLRPTNVTAELPQNLSDKGIQTGADAMDKLWIPDWNWYLDNEQDIVERVNEIFGQG